MKKTRILVKVVKEESGRYSMRAAGRELPDHGTTYETPGATYRAALLIYPPGSDWEPRGHIQGLTLSVPKKRKH